MKGYISKYLLMALPLFWCSCATYEPQYTLASEKKEVAKDSINHSFYLIGNAGNSPIGTMSTALEALEQALSDADKNSTMLFLGDNIYPSGMPKKEDAGRSFAEHQLKMQTEVVKEFPGEAIFIPGNNDWYAQGPKGLKRQENFIEDKLGKNTFIPENGCPIKKIDINEQIVMIVLDSQWFFTKWDNHPTINDDCEFRTRAKFFDEYESLVKKARGKMLTIFKNGQFDRYLKRLSILKDEDFANKAFMKNLSAEFDIYEDEAANDI